MLKIFKKRRNIFIRLIHEQASLTLEGMEILKAYLTKPDEITADKLTAKEKEADEARRILIDELNRTFITPFDREDIFALSRAIDDVLDYAYSTMTEIVIFNVAPTEYMVRICSLLRDATFELFRAIECLVDHPGVAQEHSRRAKALENQVESVYREALADMFKETDDVKQLVNMLKLREVYRHLSNAADRGDEAANVIADIVVKTT
jgi:predicted phosphate transport protein (TIGR00153 family)